MNRRLTMVARRPIFRKAAALFRPLSDEALGHLFVVDLARGLAALAVMLWHYQHFYFPSAGVVPKVMLAELPFYTYLSIFYERGYFAVNFFWLLSGFVFAAAYRPRQASTREFVVHRLARLYPLHFVTLLAMAGLQFLSLQVVGYYQVYPANDVIHFVENLFFISDGTSFNGPIWSVSVELMAYVAFWLVLPVLYRGGIIGPLTLALIGYTFAYHGPLIARVFAECVCFFFLGTAIFVAFSAIRQAPVLYLIAGLAVLAVGIETWSGHTNTALLLILASLLLLVCAVEQAEWGRHLRKVRWIGDNTYGVYLWHIPITVMALVVLDAVVGNRDVVKSGWWLVGFVLTTSLVARASYLYIERPGRAFLRQRLERRGVDPRHNVL